MLKVRVRYDVSCPKHPRFDPERDGRGAVRGECPFCLWLLDLRAAEKTFRRTLAQYQEGKSAHIERSGGAA